MAVFLLLAQSATPQQPAAPAATASIEGVVAKAVTGESLPRVTVTATEIRGAATGQRELLNAADLITLISPAGVSGTSLSAAGLATLSPAPNAQGSSRQTMTTAADGKFLLENLKPGTYSITATSPGYAPAEYGQRGPNGYGMNITLKPGQKMQGASLTMTPEGTITGRVVDANGDPLNRALVQALKVVYQEKGRSLLTVQAVPTDDKGDYRLFWLPPGQYYISATPADDRMRTIPIVVPAPNGSTSAASLLSMMYASTIPINAVRDSGTGPIAGVVPGVKVTSRTQSNGEVIEEAEVPVYYPSALDITTAAPIEVRSGGITAGVNITTTTARVYRIRGTIVNGVTGQPVTASSINILARTGPTLPQTLSVPQLSSSNSFEIAGVLPGAYYLMASGAGSGYVAVGATPVDVSAANVENVIISVAPGASISGRIVIEGAIPITAPTAGPNTLPRQQSLVVRLDPQTAGAAQASAAMMPDGTFTLPNVMPGDYRVILSAPLGSVPKSILYDGKDAQSDGLHVGGSSTGMLEIVVSANAGRLEGNVSTDRQKVANATVVLMPAFALRRQTNLYRTVQTNAEGHFTIENIPPGSYKVFAWDDVENNAWFDTEFMRNFESRGKEITIREGARETMEIPIIPR